MKEKYRLLGRTAISLRELEKVREVFWKGYSYTGAAISRLGGREGEAFLGEELTCVQAMPRL